MSTPDKSLADRKAAQKADGAKAMSEYEAEQAAVRKNMERLRALRMAREAEAPAPPARKTAARKTGSKKATGSAASTRATAQRLSDWLASKRDSGHHS